eukprot:scaffold7002_cov21-Tisochrysis_lutea.AAC.1
MSDADLDHQPVRHKTQHLKAFCSHPHSLPLALTHSSIRNTSELRVHSMHPQSAVGAGKAYDTDGRGTGTFRFWTDERRFKGPGSKCVVQEALFDAGEPLLFEYRRSCVTIKKDGAAYKGR